MGGNNQSRELPFETLPYKSKNYDCAYCDSLCTFDTQNEPSGLRVVTKICKDCGFRRTLDQSKKPDGTWQTNIVSEKCPEGYFIIVDDEYNVHGGGPLTKPQVQKSKRYAEGQGKAMYLIVGEYEFRLTNDDYMHGSPDLNKVAWCKVHSDGDAYVINSLKQ